MSKHTPTPWRQGELLYSPKIKGSPEQNEALDRQEKLRVFSNFKNKDKGKTRRLVAICQIPEDAQRIVACVNACEGLNDNQLKYLADNIREGNKARREIANIQAERDELMKALEDVKQFLDRKVACGEPNEEVNELWTTVQAAISKSKLVAP